MSRTPITRCRRAVAPSMGRSAPTFLVSERQPYGHDRQWDGSERQQRTPPVAGQHHDGERRTHQDGEIEATRTHSPEASRQCLLLRLPVGGDVPEIVGLEERCCQQSDRDAGPECEGPVEAVRPRVPAQEDREGGVLHVRRASRGHQTEEHEHEDLPETEVAIWVRPSGVRPSGQHTDEPQRQKPPGHPGRERQPGQSRHREGHRRRHPDLTDGGEPLSDEPDRPDPSNVGATRSMSA